MVAGLLTISEKDKLVGQLYDPDSYFNPVQDINNDWFISTEEIDNCIYPEFLWIKSLPIVPFIPKPSPPVSL